MSRRRAVMPLNKKAVAEADDQFYLNHPGMVRNKTRVPLERNNAAQRKLREEWMDLYVARGGAVEGTSPSKQKPADPVHECPLAEAGLPTGGLTVRVIDDSDESAIPDAIVSIESVGQQQTDGGGHADFECVAPGVYPIAAEKDSYFPVPGYEEVEVFDETTGLATLRLQLVLEGRYPAKKKKSSFGPDDKIVYLTFDDGPWAGTRETFDLVTSMGVPATYFLVGENVTASLDALPGLFRKLYDHADIEICNHSQTHAHQFFEGYYQKGGLKIDRRTLEPDSVATDDTRRSVLMDFEYASLAFSAALSNRKIRRPDDPAFDARGKLDTSKLRAYSRFLSARMPGTNIWRLPTVTAASGGGVGEKKDEADDLEANGYKIYGWDIEWEMSFDLVKALQEAFNAHRSGYIDLYTSDRIDLDRPSDSAEAVFDKTKSKFDSFGGPETKNKVVLLTHERAFRRHTGGSPNLHLDKLKKYIELCQAEGYKFDLIQNY